MKGHPSTCPEHASSGYTAGCPGCQRAAARYFNVWRQARAAGTPLTYDAVGIRRRLRALVTQGWTTTELAEATCVPCNTLRCYTRDERRSRVTAATHHAVATFYAAHELTRGSSKVGGRRALTRGWLPPLAWDLDTIDDPDATPDLGDTPRADTPDPLAVDIVVATGRLVPMTYLQTVEAIERIRRDQPWLTAAEVATRVGTKTATVEYVAQGRVKTKEKVA